MFNSSCKDSEFSFIIQYLCRKLIPNSINFAKKGLKQPLFIQEKLVFGLSANARAHNYCCPDEGNNLSGHIQFSILAYTILNMQAAFVKTQAAFSNMQAAFVKTQAAY